MQPNETDDHDLRLPHKTLVFWSATLVFLLVPVVQYKHYSTVFGFVFPVLIAVVGWIGMFRTSRILASQASVQSAKESLKKISAYVFGASAVLAAVCLMGRF
jgi:hypothetical protein